MDIQDGERAGGFLGLRIGILLVISQILRISSVRQKRLNKLVRMDMALEPRHPRCVLEILFGISESPFFML